MKGDDHAGRDRRTTKRLIQAGGSVVGVRSGRRSPLYRSAVEAGVEIRHYGWRIAAETTVVADEEATPSAGFLRLAGYIWAATRPRRKLR